MEIVDAIDRHWTIKNSAANSTKNMLTAINMISIEEATRQDTFAVVVGIESNTNIFDNPNQRKSPKYDAIDSQVVFFAWGFQVHGGVDIERWSH